MAQNQFSDVVNQVQQSPQNQRTERLIDGIAQQMQQSGNQQTQQLGPAAIADKQSRHLVLQQTRAAGSVGSFSHRISAGWHSWPQL
jgi:hypothetical protein